MKDPIASLRGVFVIAVLAGAAAGCTGRSAPPELCDQLVARYQRCADTAKLPASSLRSMRRYCEVALLYRPEPGDGPNNLAALAKAAMQKCAASEACEELLSCLEASRCSFYLEGPTDKTLEFGCLL